MHHVLGVLEDDERSLWATFRRAVQLADEENARLTLAKTTDPGRILRWLSPFTTGWLYVPLDTDPQTTASHTLARAAEFVPGWIPVTTRLLGPRTASAVQDLVAGGAYDALVATERRLAHSPRLRTELERLGLRTVAVAPTADIPEHDMNGVPL
jgi:hypothetical protein